MKEYLLNKKPKDIRFLALFRKAFNRDRKLNGFSTEESANELGISSGTLEQKLKPSSDNDLTVSEWDHHLDLTADFSTLKYFVEKHGFQITSLDINKCSNSLTEIGNQADKAMVEFMEAWKQTKESIKDEYLSKKEIFKTMDEIDEALKELQQLKNDLSCRLGKEN